MNFSEKFVNNFLAIRNAYHLSTTEMAKLLRFKSSTSITNFEKGRASLPIDAVHILCNTFCVSADWLLGRTNTPYTEESVEASEKILAKKLDLVDKRNRLGLGKYKTYLQELDEDGKDYYSLAVRANIVYLISSVQLPYAEELDNYLDDNKEAELLEHLPINFSDDPSFVAEYYLGQISKIDMLILRMNTVPYYDLT